MGSIATQIAKELNVQVAQVEAAVNLIDEGATIPFIARYRKEKTGSLDDTQLRQLDERLSYLRELAERKQVILAAIEEQKKLTPQLKEDVLNAATKTKLEDLYLPYKVKRRTKAQIAREAGLEPLAKHLWQNPNDAIEEIAVKYINIEKGIENSEQALEGARHILMETFAENATLLESLRESMWQHGRFYSTVQKGKEKQGKKFSDYFNFDEALNKIPSHRALALLRGRREGFLSLSLKLNDELSCIQKIAQTFDIIYDPQNSSWLNQTVEWTWKVKLNPKLELELVNRLREKSEEEAIDIFAKNLKDLLLLPPAGNKVTIGLDPGIRTGVKVVVIDATGKVLDHTTIYPLAPQNQWHEAIAELAKLITKHNVELISIGNGTGSRETDKLCNELLKTYKDLNVQKIVINEAGASVYSASALAAKEFPDLDVTIRGAVSIARRLQDPLAELVKISPKSIGVGQYQHDVNQIRLARSLDGVVEDCVNAVGVDLNTASSALLKYVAGLNESLANNLVKHRDEHGPFKTRESLKDVPRMGEKTFEQAAGFLKVINTENPLDNSSVHPEAYELVNQMVAKSGKLLTDLIGNQTEIKALNANDFISEEIGLPTVNDILVELEKPGRDPRPDFKTANFKEGIEEITDLEKDMILEGIVGNVTTFGAFIDVGVHQDGLVHISEMTNKFINDPRAVVKTGDIVKVRVIELDLERRRIGLSLKLTDDKPQQRQARSTPKAQHKPKIKTAKVVKNNVKPKIKKVQPVVNSAMADAFAKLKG